MMNECCLRQAGIFLGFGKWGGGCKIKVGRIFFSTPQMGCKHHPMGGANTPVFDIDLKNPGIALQANSLRGDVCAL